MDKLSSADNEWPASDLERLGACPVCESTARITLYDDVSDVVFNCAAGRWALHACEGCGNAYIDPRPTATSIGRAYTSYYTHADPLLPRPYTELSMLGKFRRQAVNGYLNYRYSANVHPASRLMGAALSVVPRIRGALDLDYRHLPRRQGKVLDFGCGSGVFLLRAKHIGWDTYGVDFDDQAVSTCRGLGLRVKSGGIEAAQSFGERFDFISLNHVIEHLHSPVATLRELRSLLAPGGLLYLETPNILSSGHREFGRWWRGLEVPRHLVIFSPTGLAQALRLSGYKLIKIIPRPTSTPSMRIASAKLLPLGVDAPNPASRGNQADDFLTVLAHAS